MSGGCFPGCIACRRAEAYPVGIFAEMRRAEAQAKWDRLRRELADPYFRPSTQPNQPQGEPEA